MDPTRGSLGKAVAIAFAAAVSVSSFHCGEDEITEANIGPKLAAAYCNAENDCCSKQGYPQTADRRLICEGTAQAGLYHPDGYVFNADVAAVCLKAAQSYKCRDPSSIDAVCRRVYTDPAVSSTPTIYGPEGAACGGAGGTCAFYDGLSCIIDDPGHGTGACRKWATTGGVCKWDTDCVIGDYCDAAGTCRVRLRDGTPCTIPNECESTYCLDSVCTSRKGCSLV
jgi:hypothetical protein